MKAKGAILLALLCFSASFGEIHFRQIDTLEVGMSVDLDSENVILNTGYLFGGNPYITGPEFDPPFTCEFTVSGMGLAWCNCDGINRTTYFETFRTDMPIDSLLKMDLDLNNAEQFTPVTLEHGLEVYSLPDTGNFILKTNQDKYCIFRINKSYLRSTYSCGNPMLLDCVFAYQIQWWYQDNGTADFRLSSPVKETPPSTLRLLPAMYGKSVYDVLGRRITDNNSIGNSRGVKIAVRNGKAVKFVNVR